MGTYANFRKGRGRPVLGPPPALLIQQDNGGHDAGGQLASAALVAANGEGRPPTLRDKNGARSGR
jgi:hypothetical protein